tara:strand:+ start:496 stop:1443 length:948 start_codon:yes stop_codon:yes gene_type:complete
MPAFNFTKNTKLALVLPGTQVYEVFPETDISFGQTFTESTSSVNTIHSPQYFERSTIVKANPASFSFTVNLAKESTNSADVLFDRAIAHDAFHLYFISDESTFKLENCVITNVSFTIARNSLLKMQIEGEAEKLIRSASNNTNNVPQITFNNFIGTLSETFVSTPSTLTRIIPKIEVTLASAVDITSCVFGVSAELQNEVKWTGYETVNQGLNVTDNTNAMYPSGFTVSQKIFSGNIRRYLQDGTESTLLNFDKDISLRIKAGDTYSGSFAGLDFNMPNVSYTNRVSAGSLYTQSFDWRLTTNSTLSTILQYNTS